MVSNLAAQQQNFRANVGVLFCLEILPQACEKHIQTRFSLLEECYLTKTKVGIRSR